MPKNQSLKLDDGRIFNPTDTLKRQAGLQKRAEEALAAARKARQGTKR